VIGVGADTYSHGWIGRRNPGERSSAALASCRSGQSGGVVPRCAARLCLGIELSRVEGQGAEVLGIISGVVVALVILLIAVPTLVLSLRAPETRTRVCFALVGHSLLVAASFWACSAVIKERPSDPILLGLLILVSATATSNHTRKCRYRACGEEGAIACLKRGLQTTPAL